MGVSRGTLQLDDEWTRKNVIELGNRIRLIEEHIFNLEHNPHAHMYVFSTGMNLSLTPAGTTIMVSGASADHEEGFTFSTAGNTSRFTCLVPAHYVIQYSISFGVSIPNRHVEVAVVKNGVWIDASSSHIDFQTASVEQTTSGMWISEFRPNDYFEIGMRCVGSTVVAIYEHFSSTAFRVHF